MNKIEHFAAFALQGILSNPNTIIIRDDGSYIDSGFIVDAAYEVAKLMAKKIQDNEEEEEYERDYDDWRRAN
jgi:hypothetical protein